MDVATDVGEIIKEQELDVLVGLVPKLKLMDIVIREDVIVFRQIKQVVVHALKTTSKEVVSNTTFQETMLILMVV